MFVKYLPYNHYFNFLVIYVLVHQRLVSAMYQFPQLFLYLWCLTHFKVIPINTTCFSTFIHHDSQENQIICEIYWNSDYGIWYQHFLHLKLKVMLQMIITATKLLHLLAMYCLSLHKYIVKNFPNYAIDLHTKDILISY